jgi:hypothetical protein
MIRLKRFSLLHDRPFNIRLIALVATGTVLLLLALSLELVVGCGSYRVKEDFEIPSGYRGWVVIERANPKCRPAVLTFTSVVLKVDPSGHGCASTPLPKGPQHMRFGDLDSQGHKRELRLGYPGNGGQIWDYSSGGMSSSDESLPVREVNEFFVGTEIEY